MMKMNKKGLLENYSHFEGIDAGYWTIHHGLQDASLVISALSALVARRLLMAGKWETMI
jgi:hypothetical protein